MRKLVACFIIFSLLGAADATAQKKVFTTIHCDPDDPTPSDSWPEKNINTVGWNNLRQMISYANAKNVFVTIELTKPWVDFILADQNKVDTINTSCV